jgi:acyl-CoA thioester hydrolase
VERQVSAAAKHANMKNSREHSHICEAKIRVRYAETDQMGVVYHANHFVWFEVGRVELLRQLGFSYRQMEQDDGCSIAVVEARCRYKAPVRYDDEVLIRTRLSNVRGSFVQFAYELVRESDGLLLAEGETTHVVTDGKMKKRTIPEKYMCVFKQAVVRIS